MRVIHARNVNDAYFQACSLLELSGEEVPSRNGPALEFPSPVTTVYERPKERVLFFGRRDANPYFHLMESLWMLAGRNDVKWLVQFNKNMANYSDDGETFHGAYGHRWRQHFLCYDNATGYIDQLDWAVERLKADPSDRRVVVQMWDPEVDGPGSDLQEPKDFPCNTAIYFKVRHGKLNMMVTNRSNDLVWGAYGANAVHFSVLQEYMAARIGVEVGIYRQVSDSLHAYLSLWNEKKAMSNDWVPDEYEVDMVHPYPMFHKPGHFDLDLEHFMAGEDHPSLYVNPFFNEVAWPMFKSWMAYKAKDQVLAEAHAGNIRASDWRLACQHWLMRHKIKTGA